MGRPTSSSRSEERCSIARLREAGQSIRQIASALDRPPSTIARELKRNSGSKVGYQPAYAQQQAKARRWTGSRLERDDALREAVLDRLDGGWSPEQIAGRLALDAAAPSSATRPSTASSTPRSSAPMTAAGATISRAPKHKRGWRAKRGGSPASLIEGRSASPSARRSRRSQRQPGHWEADVMLFATPGQAILVAHERTSRIISSPHRTASRRTDRASARQPARPMPADLRKPPSPSTTVPSSPATTGSPTSSASIPSSATPTAHGKKAASKTPSDASTKPAPQNQPRRTLQPDLESRRTPTTTPRENASASKHQPKPSFNRCTSNVNPHPAQAGMTVSSPDPNPDCLRLPLPQLPRPLRPSLLDRDIRRLDPLAGGDLACSIPKRDWMSARLIFSRTASSAIAWSRAISATRRRVSLSSFAASRPFSGAVCACCSIAGAAAAAACLSFCTLSSAD